MIVEYTAPRASGAPKGTGDPAWYAMLTVTNRPAPGEPGVSTSAYVVGHHAGVAVISYGPGRATRYPTATDAVAAAERMVRELTAEAEGPCGECDGRGWIVETYDEAELPDGFVPITACQHCGAIDDDQVAARKAADDHHGGSVAFFPGGPVEGDSSEYGHGDWAVKFTNPSLACRDEDVAQWLGTFPADRELHTVRVWVGLLVQFDTVTGQLRLAADQIDQAANGVPGAVVAMSGRSDRAWIVDRVTDENGLSVTSDELRPIIAALGAGHTFDLAGVRL